MTVIVSFYTKTFKPLSQIEETITFNLNDNISDEDLQAFIYLEYINWKLNVTDSGYKILSKIIEKK